MNSTSHTSVSIHHDGEDFEISYFLRPGGENVILYLHGLGSSKEDFLAATKVTAFADFTICAFDFPGCGRSRYPDHGLQMADLVNIAFKMCLYLALTDLNLIGHSMGGLVALLLAAKHPDRVRRLVSIEGNLAPEDCAVFSRTAVQADQIGKARDEIMAGLVRYFESSGLVGDRHFAEGFLRSVYTPAFFDYCQSIVSCSDDMDLLTTFTNLQRPRLFLFGSANNQLSYLPTLTANLIEVLEVAQGGHWMFRDNPADFYEGIYRFLTSSDEITT